MVTSQVMTVRRTASVAEIVLDRPGKLNAMNMDWVRDLEAAVAELAVEPPRVVVISGNGRAFCSGIDLDMTAEQGMPPDFFPLQEKAFTALERLPAIVIAQIHGYCLGGGLQLALACDIRIASQDTLLGLPAALEGLPPGVATWRLPRFVGMGRALRLALSGTRVTASEALDMGLVDYVVSDQAAARAIVDQYVQVPHEAAVGIKEITRSAFELDFDTAFERTRTIVAQCLKSPDTIAAQQAWSQRPAHH
jgi:enoyl-CoA hydratase